MVQSYFIYWAGIESTVLRDGSRSSWRSNIAGVDGQTSIFSIEEDEATAPPGMQHVRPCALYIIICTPVFTSSLKKK